MKATIKALFLAALAAIPASAAHIEIQTKIDGNWVIVNPGAKLGGRVIRMPDGTRVTDRATRGAQTRFVVRADPSAGELNETPVFWTLRSTQGQHGDEEVLITPDQSRVFIIPTSSNADNVTIRLEVWLYQLPGFIVNQQEQRIPVGTRP